MERLGATDRGLPGYRLRGARGAVYETYRHREDLSRLWLASTRGGRFRPDPLGPVHLTDLRGTLEICL